MIKNVLIFCEGVTDQVFIADCLEIFYLAKVNREEDKANRGRLKFDRGEIKEINGCDNLKLQINIDRLKDNSEKGGINLVIFDADEKGRGNNSFINAVLSLNGIKKHHQVDFDFYLWPNHTEDGAVENLLRQLIQPNRESIMRCIENHQKCLKDTGFNDLRQVNGKDLIRYYLHTNSVDKTEGRNLDYKNTLFWNLNPKDIPDLQKFKNFLDQYFPGIETI
jgi:hypothetical protein